MNSIVSQRLIEYLRTHFALDWHGVHGSPHWARVRMNGLRLAETTGANTRVIEAFAFIHDACRENDYDDPLHGHRAAHLARRLHGSLLDLSLEELSLLETACVGHSDGHILGDVTVCVCWDADRLDLGRVGIKPRADRLCTAAARETEVLEWAYRRSLGAPRKMDL